MSLCSYHMVTSSYWLRLIVLIVCFLTISGPSLVNTKKITYTPPSQSQLRRNFFDNKLSFITVGSVWISFLIIFIVFRLYYLDERSKLHQIFDDCSPSTVQFKYLIRLRIGKCSSIFQKETSAIMIDLLDPRHCFITRLSISPSWLKVDVYARQKSEKPRLRSLKFILNRANQLPTIGSIRMAHDSYFPVGGYVFIHSLEIRNLSENTLTQIPVFKRIFVLPPDSGEFDQVFHARSTSTDKKRSSNLYSSDYDPYLTFTEMLIFIFFYSNVTLFTTMLKPNYMEIHNLSQATFNGLTGLVPSLIGTIIFLTFYRFTVKTFYSRSKAMGSWAVVRVIFLTALTLNGLLIGLISSFIQSRQTPNTLTYWSLAILIANLSPALVIVPLIVIKSIYELFAAETNFKLLATPSFTSKVVDETKPGYEQQSSIISSILRNTKGRGGESMVDENSKSKISKFGLKSGGKSSQLEGKTDDDLEENSQLEKMIIQKSCMEEGLMEKENEVVPIKSVGGRIIHRIQSALGRPAFKEPKSHGEEKIFTIDKKIEDRSRHA